MKCINKKRKRRKRRVRAFLAFTVLVLFGVAIFFLLQNKTTVADYEKKHYSGNNYQEAFVVDDLCVASTNVSSEAFSTEDELHAVALFQLEGSKVLYAENIHERIYPASTTKILTAYLALKYGTLTDIITVGENAVGVPLDSSRAGLRQGDQLTLEALLYGLMLPSGNDSAVAIAEYISGSEEAFAELMNHEAKMLGATNSNFINPHGYQDENHYTTAYDLYLILNECIKYDKFIEVVSVAQYHTKITQKNGTYRDVTWTQSNQYVNGARSAPEGVTVIGGKTGTTDEAGACLVLYAEGKNSNPYISIVMGADNRTILYDNMSNLIAAITLTE